MRPFGATERRKSFKKMKGCEYEQGRKLANRRIQPLCRLSGLPVSELSTYLSLSTSSRQNFFDSPAFSKLDLRHEI
jgi:hypothetical protein